MERKQLSEEFETLRTIRDELKVQAHLGKLEAHDVWESLEKDWQQLESRMSVVAKASSESLDDIGQAARELAREIQRGYKRLRDSL